MSGLVSKREGSSNAQRAAHARECAVNVEEELQKICDGILELMDKNLTPSTSAGEFKGFHMVGCPHG